MKTIATLIILSTVFLGTLPAYGSNPESEYLANVSSNIEQEVPKVDFLTLSGRYGKKAASNILDGIIKEGYTKAMVYHAKGVPNKIEEPYGHNMDFEVLHYRDMKVYIDYSIVTLIEE